MIKAGVIGLGEIGAGVALCLAREGLLSAVYDLRKDAAKGHDGIPDQSTSPKEVALNADVIVIAVVDAAQTMDVLRGAEGILSAGRKGLIAIVMATLALTDLAEIRKVAEEGGVALIDCGVAGGAKAAEKGIVCLVGAKNEDLAKARPVFDAFAKYVAHMGGPGAGMTAKIVRNTIVIGCLQAGREGAELAKATGVDVQLLAQVLADSTYPGRGPMTFAGRAANPDEDPQEAQTRLSMRKVFLKDVEAALEIGRDSGVELPLMELIRARSYEVIGVRKPASATGES